MAKKALIEKHRYIIKQDKLTWFVDEFHGPNEGLVVAEVELQSENQEVDLPDWIGREVSGDSPRPLNLAPRPDRRALAYC